MSTTRVFRRNDPNCQLLDPYEDWGIERDSLDELRSLIRQVKAVSKDAAAGMIGFIADPIEIAHFITTVFKHATAGYIQFRMFVDGKGHQTWGWDKKLDRFPAVKVTDTNDLIVTAITQASRAAFAPQKVNFCPPVSTFLGPHKGSNDQIEQGVVIMVECDERPQECRQTLEAILGPPTLVVKSGGTWEGQDKCHVYWRLARPTQTSAEHEQLREAREIAASIVSSDQTAKPVVHPLRWPGSWHKKNTPRVARIAESNELDVDLDDALVKLKAAAEQRGIVLRKTRPAIHTQMVGMSRDPDLWDAERDSGHILDNWRGETTRRHYLISCYSVKIAMSAINRGYDMSADDLYHVIRRMYADNTPSSPYTDKELYHLAEESLPIAVSRVGDSPAYLVKARAKAYWAEELERVRRELAE